MLFSLKTSVNRIARTMLPFGCLCSVFLPKQCGLRHIPLLKSSFLKFFPIFQSEEIPLLQHVMVF